MLGSAPRITNKFSHVGLYASMASYILFLVSSVIVHACIRMSIHKSLMLSHFNCRIMTTSGCRTQDGFNDIGEISDLHFDGYCAVVGNVPDLFVKYKDWYLVLVEVSGMWRKLILGIERGFLTTFLFLKLRAIIPRSNQSSSFTNVKHPW